MTTEQGGGEELTEVGVRTVDMTPAMRAAVRRLAAWRSLFWPPAAMGGVAAAIVIIYSITGPVGRLNAVTVPVVVALLVLSMVVVAAFGAWQTIKARHDLADGVCLEYRGPWRILQSRMTSKVSELHFDAYRLGLVHTGSPLSFVLGGVGLGQASQMRRQAELARIAGEVGGGSVLFAPHLGALLELRDIFDNVRYRSALYLP